jgi:hypothetical protein
MQGFANKNSIQNTIQNIVKHCPQTEQHNKCGIYQIKCLE